MRKEKCDAMTRDETRKARREEFAKIKGAIRNLGSGYNDRAFWSAVDQIARSLGSLDAIEIIEEITERIDQKYGRIEREAAVMLSDFQIDEAALRAALHDTDGVLEALAEHFEMHEDSDATASALRDADGRIGGAARKF